MLFMRLEQCFGYFSVQAQDQHAGLAGPAVAGVLADAVHKRQPALAQLGFERVLAGFVFCVGQRLAPWIPCGDEGGALSLVLCHQGHELWASLADAHGERWFDVHDVVGFLEDLHQFRRWGAHGGAGSVLGGLCLPAEVLCKPLRGVFVQIAQQFHHEFWRDGGLYVLCVFAPSVGESLFGLKISSDWSGRET